MRKDFLARIVGVCLLLGGCVTHSVNHADNDEKVDLYLSTLDDKHFVWCELDLEQCRKDFEWWRNTPRGRLIISEYERADTGQTYNTHDVPNVFRTQFVDDEQVAEQKLRQDVGQNFITLGKSRNTNYEKPESVLKEVQAQQKVYGPPVYGDHQIVGEGNTPW